MGLSFPIVPKRILSPQKMSKEDRIQRLGTKGELFVGPEEFQFSKAFRSGAPRVWKKGKYCIYKESFVGPSLHLSFTFHTSTLQTDGIWTIGTQRCCFMVSFCFMVTFWFSLEAFARISNRHICIQLGHKNILMRVVSCGSWFVILTILLVIVAFVSWNCQGLTMFKIPSLKIWHYGPNKIARMEEVRISK